MIELENVTKIYKMGQTKVLALDHINLQIQAGEMVAIMGPSGSGKSTMMAILGCLDIPTEGVYRLEGEPVEKLNDNQLAQVRSRKVGFVFQQFNLLPRTSALENVMLPLLYDGVRGKARTEKAKTALETVGLADRIHHRPNQLSGGEQQRVAIARALVNDPTILLADEPTGNLDTKTGDDIIGLFQKLHEDHGQTVIYVTHDAFIARHTQRIIRLVDGKIISDDPVVHPLVAGTPRPEEVVEG
ncbi:MAG: ABC transporter ATP-binding protein [Anaerolineales bacterium]|jgi:putative ABC transport system ATP-binding protein